MNLHEFFELFFLRIKIQLAGFIEYLQVVKRYYSNAAFRKVDLSLQSHYLLRKPFKISKEFLRSRGENNLYAYGETPLTTGEKIVKICEINPEDVVYEVGSGRGRFCFWLACVVGCKAVGIEYIPEFVHIANEVKKKYHLDHVEFRLESFFRTNFAEATVIYLYGTSLDDGAIVKLIERLKTANKGTKVITVSYPLSAYSEHFELIKSFPAQFPWGETEIFLQRLK